MDCARHVGYFYHAACDSRRPPPPDEGRAEIKRGIA